MSRAAEQYACLYVPEFPAQTLVRLRPDLREQACVVMAGDPPLQQVCSLNTRARLLGIARGMTQVEVDTFPECVVLSRSNQTEKMLREILLECAGSFSPRLEAVEGETTFACMIDITGTEALFGSPEMLAKRLLQQVRALGITARMTISRNFHAALLLARGASARAPIRLVLPGEEAHALSSLPIAVLPLTEAQAETFSQWGIGTLGRLAELPEKELIARMGQEAKRLRQLARGELSHLFQPVEPAFTLQERMEFDFPVEVLDSLLFVMNVMLDQLILRASARILALSSITATLELDGGDTHVRTVRPALPSNEKQTWIKLLHLDMEAHPPSASILALTLLAEPGHTSKVQLGLFSPQLPEASRLDVTLARIRALVGENCVGRPVLEDTHSRDGFRMEAFTVPSGVPTVMEPAEARMPLRQLRPAEKITCTLQEGRPVRFFFRQVGYRVEQAYGPWRTSGDWWNDSLWGQEQWDIIARSSDKTQLCCCLAHDLMQGVWQMVALYD